MLYANYVNIDGRLVRTPELKTSKNGVAYTRFSICYNQSKKLDEPNERGYMYDNIPHFFNCVCYKKTAEAVAKFSKGQMVRVIGKLNFNKYENAKGETVNSVNISADSVLQLKIDRKTSSDNRDEEFENQIVYEEKEKMNDDVYIEDGQNPFDIGNGDIPF